MKMTVTRWTQAQTILDEWGGEAKQVSDYIEHRTWGAQWSANKAIGLNKKHTKLVEDALAEYDTRNGAASDD